MNAETGFNGAPRLGLGDGIGRLHRATTWACFNGAPRLGLGDGRSAPGPAPRLPPASMGLRDWVSEMGCSPQSARRSCLCFNGAPRLGLGDGLAADLNGLASSVLLQWGSETGSRRWRQSATAPQSGSPWLQWGSETGSRRWAGRAGRAREHPSASMGLREWVSEMVCGASGIVCSLACFNGAPRLGLGDGTGNLRRVRREGGASMGLRDWVSEMVLVQTGTYVKALPGFNGAPRLGLGDGSARASPSTAPPLSFNGAPRLGLGDGR